MLKLFFVLAAVTSAPLLAQAPGVPLGIPGYTATASPWGFPIKRVNNLDTAPIFFEGQRLFVVAAPAAPADAPVPPIVQRVDTITDNLQRIVPAAVSLGNRPASHFDPKTFKVSIGSENGYPTLYATDGSRREVAPIMTLTEPDATLNSMSKNDLAVQWQGVLEAALGRALLTAEPQYFASQLRKLPFVILGGVLATRASDRPSPALAPPQRSARRCRRIGRPARNQRLYGRQKSARRAIDRFGRTAPVESGAAGDVGRDRPLGARDPAVRRTLSPTS